jgi:integration host factor subunit alpha
MQTVSKNLTKDDISINISKITGFSKSISKKIINDLLDILSKNIKHNHTILKNFGSFKIIKKKERFGRNPKTKENFLINSRNTIKFVVSGKLKNTLNINK